MNLAYQTAAEHFLAEWHQPRRIAHRRRGKLGDVDPNRSSKKVEGATQARHRLIASASAGKDSTMICSEVLSRNRRWTYGFLQFAEEAASDLPFNCGCAQGGASECEGAGEFIRSASHPIAR